MMKYSVLVYQSYSLDPFEFHVKFADKYLANYNFKLSFDYTYSKFEDHDSFCIHVVTVREVSFDRIFVLLARRSSPSLHLPIDTSVSLVDSFFDSTMVDS